MTQLTLTILIGLTAATLCQSQPTADRSKRRAAECAVWNRELAFAQSVEKHDAKAFAAYLNPGAVFSAGAANAARGRESVLANWASLIEGKTLHVRWHPDIVNIGGDPNIAISRGPFMIEDLTAAAKAQYSVGHFTTIWTRQSPVAPWLVLFDAGGEPPTPVENLQAAEKFMSQAPTTCPAL